MIPPVSIGAGVKSKGEGGTPFPGRLILRRRMADAVRYVLAPGVRGLWMAEGVGLSSKPREPSVTR